MRQDQYSRTDSIKVKARAGYKCQECGFDYAIQAHAPKGDHSDWENGVALCAGCHASKHPNVPENMFFSKTYQPYWLNVSARELGRRFGCHSRTIIRRSKKLNIPMRIELTEKDIKRLSVDTKSLIANIANTTGQKCPDCNSKHITRHGHIIRKSGKVRRYQCADCAVTFYDLVNTIGVDNYHYNDKVNCPKCESRHVVRHGIDIKNRQRYRCQQCSNMFHE